MPDILPLPFKNRIRNLLHNSSAHPGLIFERYFPCWEGETKIEKAKPSSEAYKEFLNCYGKKKTKVEKLLKNINHRLNNLVNAYNGKELVFESVERIAIGLGIEHPTENGFLLDRTCGVPYIPGAAIKGVCRAYAKLLGKEAHITDLLGREEPSHQQGDIIFLPAYPEEVPGLILDVITNHHQDYYTREPQERKFRLDINKGNYPLPMDIEIPVPVFHLALKEGVKFYFRLISISGNQENLQRVGSLLAEALEYLKIGAKTSVGYGGMKIVSKRPEMAWEVEPVKGVIQTFISYSHEDKEKVLEFIATAAPYGVSPWRDEDGLMPHLGEELWTKINQAIEKENVVAVSLFLSENSVASEEVLREIEFTHRLKKHIIPILLEKTEEVNSFLEKYLKLERGYYLRVEESLAPQKWADTLLNQARVKSATEVVFYLGHREAVISAKIPEKWQNMPAIVLRNSEYWLNPFGKEGQDWNPKSEEDYQKYEDGFRFLRVSLDGVKRLYLCGYTPLGIAGMIGKYWDRATGIKLITWNSYTGEEWSVGRTPPEGWVEEKSKHLQVLAEERLNKSEQIAICHFANNDRGKTQYKKALKWIEENLPVGKVFCFGYPAKITGEMAEEVAKECSGTFIWAKEKFLPEEIHWFSDLPMALMPLVTYLTRAVGKIIFYDEHKERHIYIKAFEKH